MADSVERVNVLVQEDRQITVTDIAKKLDISGWSAYFIIHRDFRYHKICVKAAYRWAQMHTCGNMHTVFIVIHVWNCKQCQSVEWKHVIVQDQKFKSVPSASKWCWSCFGTLMGPSSSTTRIMDRWSMLHIVQCLKRSWNPLFTLNAEEFWQIELFCIVSTLKLIWQHLPLNQFKYWNASFSPTQHTVQTLPHACTIFSDCSKMWMLICKWWRDQGHGTYMASCKTGNILRRWHREICGPK